MDKILCDYCNKIVDTEIAVKRKNGWKWYPFVAKLNNKIICADCAVKLENGEINEIK